MLRPEFRPEFRLHFAAFRHVSVYFSIFKINQLQANHQWKGPPRPVIFAINFSFWRTARGYFQLMPVPDPLWWLPMFASNAQGSRHARAYLGLPSHAFFIPSLCFCAFPHHSSPLLSPLSCDKSSVTTLNGRQQLITSNSELRIPVGGQDAGRPRLPGLCWLVCIACSLPA